MIRNKFVYEIDSDIIDHDFFITLGKNHITQEWIDAPAPIALKYTDENILIVDDYEYLKSIRARFPLLKPFIKLLKFEAGTIPIHIDAQRNCTLNIPIKNCNEKTVTSFYADYKPVEKSFEYFGSAEPRVWHSNEYITYIEGGVKIFEFSLTRPALMDTHTAHGIVNNSNSHRLIWSWTYDGSYEDAVRVFSSV